MENENEANNFLLYLKEQHPNIKFTMEKEKFKKIEFLDISISKTESRLESSIYRKQTDTGLLTNFNSYTCFKYKIGLIQTLIDRVFNINSTKESFNNDINDVSNDLQKNEYTKDMIDRNIKDYLDKKLQPKEDNKIINEKYFKYIENKLKQLIKQFCKTSVSIKIAYTPH